MPMENQREEMDMNQNEEIISENKETVADKLPDSQEGVDATDGQALELEKLQTELTEQKDKYLRLYSEFENFRRRTAKEKNEMVLSANEQLIKTLIPVVDDFERAEKA